VLLLVPANLAQTDLKPDPQSLFQPLSKQEKLDHFIHNTFGVRDVMERSVLAGLAQWRNSTPEWGQGVAGYGRRLSSNFGQYSIKKTLQFSIGAAMNEDPRYFSSTENGVWRRTLHAVSHTVMVRNDQNRRVFAVGRVTGTLGGSVISRVWHPDRLQTPGHALRNASLSVGTEAGWNVLREFWPEIKRAFRKGK